MRSISLNRSDSERLHSEDLSEPPGQAVPSEKHFRITVVRNSADSPVPSTYFVVKTGMLYSLRNQEDGSVRIGRQQMTEEGIRPNDIMLPANDRAISRSHCMITYSSFFTRRVPEEWISFLMVEHPRLGSRSVFQYLPPELLRYILLFLKEPLSPHLIDIGSMCGTYVKVSNSEPIDLAVGQTFLVGSDILIEIDKLVNDPLALALNSDMTIEDYFHDSDMEIDDLGPYIVVKTSRYPSDNEETMQPHTRKFVAEGKYKKITIGRSQMCDVYLPENTISRTQCRIVYDCGKWMLLDGLENKPTVNGTWLSIVKRNREVREVSEPFPLSNGSQIKISDTILQVDWNDNNN